MPENLLLELPKPTDLIRRMGNSDFWEAFFSAFLLTVHPAEFAVRVPHRGDGPKEEALSAAFQRAFFLHRHTLGLEHWIPALEAPVVNQENEYRWCDLTFTPWVSELEKASWEAAKDLNKHVRVEVKWLYDQQDQSLLLDRAHGNTSEQHFVIILQFVNNGFTPPIQQGEIEGHPSIRCTYAAVKERLGASEFHYKHFALTVLHHHTRENAGQQS